MVEIFLSQKVERRDRQESDQGISWLTEFVLVVGYQGVRRKRLHGKGRAEGKELVEKAGGGREVERPKLQRGNKLLLHAGLVLPIEHEGRMGGRRQG